jgi:hypothetical protein
MTPIVDLAALSTDLGVLPPSPPWSATGPALERLDHYQENRRRYEGFDDDVNFVGSFAKMLAANQRVLTLALVCGAVAGRFKGGAFDESVAGGVRAIRDAYGFGDAGRADATIAKTLETLADEIKRRWPSLTPHVRRLETCIGDQDHDAWSAALREAGTAILADVAFSAEDRQRALEGAWGEWHRFLLSADGQKPFAPGLDNVLCLAANIGPHTVVRARSETMTLTDWSSAYCRALLHPSTGDLEFAPAWLGVLAGLQLAPLPSYQARREASKLFPQVDLGDVALMTTSAPTDAPTVSRLSGLIVYESLGAFHWPAPSGYAAVAWTAKQASEALAVLKAAGRAGPLWTPIDHVFIEATVSADEAGTIIKALKDFPRVSHDLSVIAFAFGRHAAKPAWAERVIQQPEDAVALLRTAEAHPVADADALPARTKALFTSGARLSGSIEAVPSGARTELDVELTPQGPHVDMTWALDQQNSKAWLSLQGDLVVHSRLVTRRFAILFDGVTIRAEQHAAYFLDVDNPIVQLLTRLFVDHLSFEFKEETQGWTAELTTRARGSSPGRRARIQLFNASPSPAVNAPPGSKAS